MRIALLGVNGMLGADLFRHLGSYPTLQVMGLMRGDPRDTMIGTVPSSKNTSIVGGISYSEGKCLAKVLREFAPNVMVNCIGWRKQPQNASQTIEMIAANALLPHRLAMLAGEIGARLIHFSSDAVFSGKRGRYLEHDVPDPVDAYGVSKLLGEPNYPHCLILRTSMIGHVSKKSDQLVDWLIRQKGIINGYQKTVFSGLPTIEIASIMRTILLPRTELVGIWNLAAAPISKFELLKMIVEKYNIDVDVVPVAHPTFDRSLNASRFLDATGYVVKPWPELIEQMYENYKNNF